MPRQDTTETNTIVLWGDDTLEDHDRRTSCRDHPYSHPPNNQEHMDHAIRAARMGTDPEPVNSPEWRETALALKGHPHCPRPLVMYHEHDCAACGGAFEVFAPGPCAYCGDKGALVPRKGSEVFPHLGSLVPSNGGVLYLALCCEARNAVTMHYWAEDGDHQAYVDGHNYALCGHYAYAVACAWLALKGRSITR